MIRSRSNPSELRRRISDEIAPVVRRPFSITHYNKNNDEATNHSSNTVAVEDHLGHWNLDIETGQIEQDLTTSSSAFNGSSDRSKEQQDTSKLLRLCWQSHSSSSSSNNSNSTNGSILKTKLEKVEQDGGDFRKRFQQAFRASMGSLIFFSILVFTSPKYLGAIWIGNIFLQSSLKDNVGSSLQAVRGYAHSISLTTLLALPIAYGLSHAQAHVSQVLLPPLTFCLSYGIMSCPWLTSPNLMILVMYVVIAAPVRFENTLWWEPIGNLGSYMIGLAVALFMNLIPLQNPNTATQQVHRLMQDKLGKDLFSVLLQARYYTYSTGQSPQMARAAGAAIEVLVTRMASTIQELKQLLPATTRELGWAGKQDQAQRLTLWVNHLDQNALSHFKMLRSALNQRYLGETNQSVNRLSSMNTRHVRHVIASEMGADYHHFIDALIHVLVACNHHADPYTTAKQQAHSSVHSNIGDLSERLEACQQAFAQAMCRVTEEVRIANNNNNNNNNEEASFAATPIFAHLARRMTSFHSMFSIAKGVIDFTKEAKTKERNENGESDLDEDDGDNPQKEKRALRYLLACFFLNVRRLLLYAMERTKAMGNFVVETWWKPKWLWNKPESRRLALKTALGMFFASLWMAVPQLWEVAQPFGVWPGLTVASVNLSNTGSSFHKAIDRLVGTLFAAAYALMVADFFPGNQDSAKIPAIALFTFCVMYMKNSNHAYQYTYAATSIGSMLYGSVKNDYDVKGYIPQRIQLIVVGVVIFAIIELFLFPRSSRRIVEMKSLEFFDLIPSFLKKASEFAMAMQDLRAQEEDTKGDAENINKNTELQTCAKQSLQYLLKSQAQVRSTAMTLKKELVSGLKEPSFGFSQQLHAQSLNGLSSEICEIEVQAFLLVDALKDALSAYNKRNVEIDDVAAVHMELMDWPRVYAAFLDKARLQMKCCSENLIDAYPDGRLRPQNGNTLKAITAAASFRDFYDVRLDLVSSWSQNYQRLGGDETCVNKNELVVLGVTTSFLLELCRHLQLAGSKMELYTQQFPAYS